MPLNNKNRNGALCHAKWMLRPRFLKLPQVRHIVSNHQGLVAAFGGGGALLGVFCILGALFVAGALLRGRALFVAGAVA